MKSSWQGQIMPLSWILPILKTMDVSQKTWRPVGTQECNEVSVSYVLCRTKGWWALFPEKETVYIGKNFYFY